MSARICARVCVCVHALVSGLVRGLSLRPLHFQTFEAFGAGFLTMLGPLKP